MRPAICGCRCCAQRKPKRIRKESINPESSCTDRINYDTASPPSVPVILNPTAVTGAVWKRIGPIKTAFARMRMTGRGCRKPQRSARRGARRTICGRGAALVVSLGGDGMVRAVGAGLIGTQTSLWASSLAGEAMISLEARHSEGNRSRRRHHRRGMTVPSISSTSTGGYPSAMSASDWTRGAGLCRFDAPNQGTLGLILYGLIRAIRRRRIDLVTDSRWRKRASDSTDSRKASRTRPLRRWTEALSRERRSTTD